MPTGGTLDSRDVTTGLSEAVLVENDISDRGVDIKVVPCSGPKVEENSVIRDIAEAAESVSGNTERIAVVTALSQTPGPAESTIAPRAETEGRDAPCANKVPLPMPGTDEFAELCRSLDCRSVAYRCAKRAFDVSFSGIILLIGLIPSVILCAAIAVDTRDFPIYSQLRVGRHGKPFRIYKFRSMVSDADNVEKYFTSEQLVAWKRERKVDHDPRVTRLGRLIRKTSIDELPQFVNVLLGQISVIGPRPISYDELSWFGNDAALVCSVPGGITGLWQASERNNATFESGERQRIELDYVRHAGFRMDAKCFLRTFDAMFGKRSGQ